MLPYLIGLAELLALVALVGAVAGSAIGAVVRAVLSNLFGRGVWLLSLAPLYAALFGTPAFVVGYAVGGLGFASKLGTGGAAGGVALIAAAASLHRDDDS